MIRTVLMVCVGLAVTSWTGVVSAREAGEYIVRVGFSNVDPDSSNGTVLDGAAELDVDDAWSLTFNGTYMITEFVGVELLAALPFDHDISANVSGLGNVDLGSTKQLPPTLSLQLHSMPIGADGKLHFYGGLGVNYTIFFDEELSGGAQELLGTDDFSLDNSFGFAAQAGVDYALTDRMLLNLEIRYIGIESDVELAGQDIGDAEIDPIVYGINLGWRF